VTAKTRAEWVLVGATLIWGSTFVIGKFVLREMTPLQMIFLRFGVATVIILALGYKTIFPLRPDQILKGVVLGIFLYFGFVAQTVGLMLTTASKSAFLTGMMVVFVPFLQIIVERRLPKLGDALCLLCALLFAVYIVYLDVVSDDMTAMQLTFVQAAVNTILAAGSLLLFESAPWHFSGSVLGAVLFLTIFATVLTTFLQAKYQKFTTPTRATIIFALEPIWAAGAAALFLGETLGWMGVFGGGLILAGVLVSQLSEDIPFLGKSLDSLFS
jgi:drug/metabolite transporter (DMT)-like permease